MDDVFVKTHHIESVLYKEDNHGMLVLNCFVGVVGKTMAQP